MIESANNSLKRGLVHRESFPDTEHLQQRVNEWVRFYNNVRIHSTLGYMGSGVSRGQGAPWKLLKICSKSSEVLLNLLSSRNGKGSTVITTSLMFGRWNEVLDDPVLTGTIVDRIARKAHVVDMAGELQGDRD